MPIGPLFELNDVVQPDATKRLVWDIERVGAAALLNDKDLYYMNTDSWRSVKGVTFLHYTCQEAASGVARYIYAEAFVGKRADPKTVHVEYRGTVPYTYWHNRKWEERVDETPYWMQIIILLTFPFWCWWETSRVVGRSVWEEYNGVVAYQGTVPYTYTHRTLIDPFVEDHYGPLKREGNMPRQIEMAAYDYPSARWNIQ